MGKKAGPIEKEADMDVGGHGQACSREFMGLIVRPLEMEERRVERMR